MPPTIEHGFASLVPGPRKGLREAVAKSAADLLLRFASALTLVAIGTSPAGAADGKAIALQGNGRGSVPCVTCHSIQAQSEAQLAAGFPRLSGLNAGYIETQIEAYASGTRPKTLMMPIGQALSSDEIEAVAKFYAALPIPENKSPSSASAGPGESIAQRGLWANGVPPCVQCHGPNATGTGAVFPALTGQTKLYLINQLQAWKKNVRPPGPLGLMPAIAKRLSDEEVNAVAEYLATQAPRRPTAPKLDGLEGMPKDEFGDMVRLGYRIFVDTPRFARKFTGNDLSCANCHLDAGRLADAAPMWGAWVSYPAYRSKNKHVNSYSERIQGCFRYSMNGKVPPLGSLELLALESYSSWLAKGKPVGEKIKGRGYPTVKKPALAPDYERGRAVYAEHCALCHQKDGGGLRVAGQTRFPALWGPDSFNWGAGMHSLKNAPGFIQANMPLGLGGTLSDQQAWDVALYVDSHERPQDPRFTGSVADTRSKYHNSPMSMYGVRVNGHLLGEGSVPAGGKTRAH